MTLKKEIEDALSAVKISSQRIRRPELNTVIEKELTARGWAKQPRVVGERDDLEMEAKLDFIKERVGIEVAFSYASLICSSIKPCRTLP